jgi:hypothetical protein
MAFNSELLIESLRISKHKSSAPLATYFKQIKDWKQYLREGIFLNTVLAMKSWNLCA